MCCLSYGEALVFVEGVGAADLQLVEKYPMKFKQALALFYQRGKNGSIPKVLAKESQ